MEYMENKTVSHAIHKLNKKKVAYVGSGTGDFTSQLVVKLQVGMFSHCWGF